MAMAAVPTSRQQAQYHPVPVKPQHISGSALRTGIESLMAGKPPQISPMGSSLAYDYITDLLSAYEQAVNTASSPQDKMEAYQAVLNQVIELQSLCKNKAVLSYQLIADPNENQWALSISLHSKQFFQLCSTRDSALPPEALGELVLISFIAQCPDNKDKVTSSFQTLQSAQGKACIQHCLMLTNTTPINTRSLIEMVISDRPDFSGQISIDVKVKVNGIVIRHTILVASETKFAKQMQVLFYLLQSTAVEPPNTISTASALRKSLDSETTVIGKLTAWGRIRGQLPPDKQGCLSANLTLIEGRDTSKGTCQCQFIMNGVELESARCELDMFQMVGKVKVLTKEYCKYVTSTMSKPDDSVRLSAITNAKKKIEGYLKDLSLPQCDFHTIEQNLDQLLASLGVDFTHPKVNLLFVKAYEKIDVMKTEAARCLLEQQKEEKDLEANAKEMEEAFLHLQQRQQDKDALLVLVDIWGRKLSSASKLEDIESLQTVLQAMITKQEAFRELLSSENDLQQQLTTLKTNFTSSIAQIEDTQKQAYQLLHQQTQAQESVVPPQHSFTLPHPQISSSSSSSSSLHSQPDRLEALSHEKNEVNTPERIHHLNVCRLGIRSTISDEVSDQDVCALFDIARADQLVDETCREQALTAFLWLVELSSDTKGFKIEYSKEQKVTKLTHNGTLVNSIPRTEYQSNKDKPRFDSKFKAVSCSPSAMSCASTFITQMVESSSKAECTLQLPKFDAKAKLRVQELDPQTGKLRLEEAQKPAVKSLHNVTPKQAIRALTEYAQKLKNDPNKILEISDGRFAQYIDNKCGGFEFVTTEPSILAKTEKLTIPNIGVANLADLILGARN